MRITVTLDDELVKAVHDYSGIEERAAAIRFAIQRYVQWEASRRLALLGGTEPDIKPIPRRRSDPA